MARKQDDNLFTDDDLTAAFLDEADLSTPAPAPAPTMTAAEDNWEEDADDLMGQLAVDVFETEGELVIKARTAGVDRNDLDVSISDGILTISGTLSSGDETEVNDWCF